MTSRFCTKGVQLDPSKCTRLTVYLSNDPARPCRPKGGFGLVWKKSWSLVLPKGTHMTNIEVEIQNKKLFQPSIHISHKKRTTQSLVYIQRRGLHKTLVTINPNFWREGQKELEHLKHCKRPFLKIMFKVPLEGTPRSSQAHLISKAKPPPPPLLLLQFYQGWIILRKRDINLLLLPILTTSADGCFALCVFLRGRHHR